MRFVAERAAIAAVTMAATLLGYSRLWIDNGWRHGPREESILMFLGCTFLGAAVAKGAFPFSDGRPISFVLLAFGALGGLIAGRITCLWCADLRMTPFDIAWIAGWIFAGAFFATRMRFRLTELAATIRRHLK